MSLEQLKNKIVYFAMLISVIMIFLCMQNNVDASFQGQETVLIIALPILYILINLCMYFVISNTDKKEYIKSIIIFYSIVYIFSIIDIYLFEKNSGYSHYEHKFFYSILIGKIVISGFFVLTLFISNICLVYHINKYNREEKSKLIFLKNMFTYAVKCSIPYFVCLITACIKSKLEFGTGYVLGQLIIGLPMLISFLVVVLIISIIVFVIVYFSTYIHINNEAIKKIIVFVTSLLFIIAPIIMFREDILAPSRNLYKAIGIYNELTGNSKEASIKEYVNCFSLAPSVKEANVGEIVKFGKCFLKSNKWAKEDNYYYVFDKNGDELTLLSLYVIDKLEYDDLLIENDEYRYKKYLDTVFYNNAFSGREKKMIVEKTYEDGRKHKVYVPNYKYYLLDTQDARDSVIERIFVNLQVYKKFIRDKKEQNQTFGIVLSETKLKKDNIRVGAYNEIDQESYYSVKEKSILDLIDIKNYVPDVSYYLRPVITVNINR